MHYWGSSVFKQKTYFAFYHILQQPATYCCYIWYRAISRAEYLVPNCKMYVHMLYSA